MIDNGTLKAGDRLPSVRKAAVSFEVGKNTVVEAYGRLAAQQVIHSRPGAGYFVASEDLETAPDLDPVLDASDTISLLRAQLNQEYAIRPGDGRPPPSWMRDALPKKIDTALFASTENDRTGYGNPQGYGRLRDLIARRFSAAGTPLSPAQIVTTFGANHGLDLIIRRYLGPGQRVLVDDPGYYPLFAKLRLAQIQAIPVPRGKNGPDLEALEEVSARFKPKLFFTQSTAQNPTGTSYDLRTAHGALQIADRHGYRIVDDDPFIDLPGTETAGRRLWELDGFRSVILVGSFSKLLSASFRSGFVAANEDTVEELSEFKMITAVNSSRLSEIMIAHMIETGRFDKHLNRLEQRLAEAKKVCLDAFARLGLKLYADDPDGYYTLLKLPSGTDIDQLRANALKHRVFLALGQWFSPQDAARSTEIRVNFARSADQRFFTFLEKCVATRSI